VLQSENALESTEVSLKQYKELDRVVMARISQEAVLKSDGLQVKAQLAQQEYKIVQLKDGLQDQKEYLNSLLGRDLNVDFRVEQVPPISAEETDMKAAQQIDYSQQRLAEYGVQPSNLKDILSARNITLPGRTLEVGPKTLTINPSGRFDSAQVIGNVIIGTASNAAKSPVYLRDLVDISRGYQSPARYLNYMTWRDEKGN
jgi:multidrug efflux pump subunit AcrB